MRTNNLLEWLFLNHDPIEPRDWTIIPEQTAQIARAAFPKGNIYMMMPDELGVLYSDSDFVTLFRADSN
jgi:transposase